VVERLEFRSTIVGETGKKFDLLLGVPELSIALPEEPDTTFIAGQRLFEVGRAIFQFTEDGLQFRKRLLEGQWWRVGRGHDVASSAGRTNLPWKTNLTE
jgi:hypothetical protein